MSSRRAAPGGVQPGRRELAGREASSHRGLGQARAQHDAARPVGVAAARLVHAHEQVLDAKSGQVFCQQAPDLIGVLGGQQLGSQQPQSAHHVHVLEQHLVRPPLGVFGHLQSRVVEQLHDGALVYFREQGPAGSRSCDRGPRWLPATRVHLRSARPTRPASAGPHRPGVPRIRLRPPPGGHPGAVGTHAPAQRWCCDAPRRRPRWPSTASAGPAAPAPYANPAAADRFGRADSRRTGGR